jgi:hypothetical protein
MFKVEYMELKGRDRERCGNLVYEETEPKMLISYFSHSFINGSAAISWALPLLRFSNLFREKFDALDE